MTYTPNAKEVPLRIVGSSIFGRYPIISDERTWNMFISDDWLINFAGYEETIQIVSTAAEGRGLYHSSRGNFLLAVINEKLYRINPNLGWFPLLTLATRTGEVFMDENLFSQIAIVDGINCYMYNYTTGSFGLTIFDSSTTPPFIPNYVTYQNNYFIFGNGSLDTSGSQWFVYQSGFNPTTLADPLKLELVQTLTLQTKPDFAKAAVRIPSHGNNLLVMGATVSEIWTNVQGLQIYQRQSSVNIDYGVASVSTIAAGDDMIVWLGINEKSSAAIMVMSGGQAKQLSTDGIDYLLSTVKHPEQSTAMFYRQDGHVFYILTFINPDDNFSIMYDFRTEKFFDITDWDFTYHPARQMAYFNNNIYFISIKQGSLMKMASTIETISTNVQNIYEIPRIRKTDTFRLPASQRFIVNRFGWTMANGTQPDVNFEFECDGFILGEVSSSIMYTEDDIPILVEGGSCQIYRPRIDVTISKNGGFTYGNSVSYFLHGTGHYKNQPTFSKLGEANQFTAQLRFWTTGNIQINDVVLEVYT
jgi:hypothetical protein